MSRNSLEHCHLNITGLNKSRGICQNPIEYAEATHLSVLRLVLQSTNRVVFRNVALVTSRRSSPAAEPCMLHCEGSGKLDRARSRLYRGEIFQGKYSLESSR